MDDSTDLMRTWFGKPIDYLSEPWYRFGRVISLVERNIPVPGDGRWLDVGCQIGQFVKLVKARFGIKATGIDQFAASEAAEICRKFFAIQASSPDEVLDGTWSYFARDIEKNGFDLAERFNVISALEVIEHLIDTDAFLRECRNHLVGAGYLVISTPNINSLRNRIQVPLGVYPAGMEHRNVIHHVRLYNVKRMASQFEEHGFEMKAISGVTFLPARWMRIRAIRRIDAILANALPALCGNVIAIFQVCPAGAQREL